MGSSSPLCDSRRRCPSINPRKHSLKGMESESAGGAIEGARRLDGKNIITKRLTRLEIILVGSVLVLGCSSEARAASEEAPFSFVVLEDGSTKVCLFMFQFDDIVAAVGTAGLLSAVRVAGLFQLVY